MSAAHARQQVGAHKKHSMALVAQRLFGAPVSLLSAQDGTELLPAAYEEEAAEPEHTVLEGVTPGDDDAAEAAAPSVTLAHFHALTLKDLRALAKHVGVSAAGGKALLVERITAAEAPGELPAQWAHLAPWWAPLPEEE